MNIALLRGVHRFPEDTAVLPPDLHTRLRSPVHREEMISLNLGGISWETLGLHPL